MNCTHYNMIYNGNFKIQKLSPLRIPFALASEQISVNKQSNLSIHISHYIICHIVYVCYIYTLYNNYVYISVN